MILAFRECYVCFLFFFFSSRRRHTRCLSDWSSDVCSSDLTDRRADSALKRELGRWDLTALGVNQVIGSAVFALPAALAASAGPWSPWMVAAVGVASMLIALSFAEVSSRFDDTGGAYLYSRAAFGRFAAFEVG